ncbi:MAG: T9SS type A sorting domain-containing protein, partial [candidate division KSB1 bacterium]|nr:T9SS type A sorting domain-containing protein [candidate division KSB1 bacterium]
ADVDYSGNMRFHGPISVTVDAKPSGYSLSQNYPNPFNPETAINFSLKEAGKVTLKIYNLQGQLVRTLVDEEKLAGSYSVMWNGTADNGAKLASGIYYYTLKVNGFEASKKLALIK